ncbi:nuclear transport factor 2 family protein [Novosphingobium sp.]|uniref:nuclear transport factor 2 family protein n=1 Tax=Novosphingobium sp. TaxID=1874826 RepID=UPI00333EEF25
MQGGAPGLLRRELLAGSLAGAAGLVAAPGCAATPRPGRFDRAAYDRYVALMNAGDPHVVDFYADDVKFVMGIRGRAAVRDFYARHRPYVRESLEVLFFCADATGAAAEVHSTLRCLKDCDDSSVFGRALRAGEVMRTHGYLLYVLNPQGLIVEVKGPPPEVLQPWQIEAG